MTWLYLPSTSSRSAPESAGLSSASSSLSPIRAQQLAASATWRGKPLPPRAWLRLWKQAGFIRHLSGLTCSPLMAAHGAASFMCSLPATPVRKTPSPESAQEPQENASSLPKSAAWPHSAGLILSSGKTCRGTRVDSLKPSSRHWSDWATALRQEYSARPELAIPCAENDCSSWPSPKTVSGQWERDWNGNVYPTTEGAAQNWTTPQAHDVTKRGSGSRLNRNSGNACLAWDAEIAAKKWIAPSATDSSRCGTITPAMTGTSLTQQVNSLGPHWAAPASQNHKGSSQGSSQGSMIRRDGKSRGDLLHYQAELLFPYPPSFQDQMTPAGPTSSIAIPNTLPPSVKRKLNPLFVEALMRWPTGLSGFARPATAWTRWWQQQLTYLSALASMLEPEQQDLWSDAA